MRPIDADTLLANIHNAMCADCNDECAACQWRDAIKLIEEAPTIGGWVSVKDRLPEESGEVLVVWVSEVGVQHFTVVEYSSKHQAFNATDSLPDAKYKINGATHWMLLPEPPERVSGNGQG